MQVCCSLRFSARRRCASRAACEKRLHLSLALACWTARALGFFCCLVHLPRSHGDRTLPLRDCTAADSLHASCACLLVKGAPVWNVGLLQAMVHCRTGPARFAHFLARIAIYTRTGCSSTARFCVNMGGFRAAISLCLLCGRMRKNALRRARHSLRAPTAVCSKRTVCPSPVFGYYFCRVGGLFLHCGLTRAFFARRVLY